jgi:hypothetical protein
MNAATPSATPAAFLFPPLDRRLGIPDRGASARLVKKACDANHAGSFEKAAVIFRSLTGLRITAKKVQLLTERVGAVLVRQRDAATASFMALESHPEPPKAPLPLLVITADGGRVQTLQDSPDERWKEDKIGVVYDATPKPEVPDIEYEGPAPIARSIVATMESWDQLGDHLSALADRRGAPHALDKVFISDGATHLRSLRERCFPDAQFILDWTHATEHVHQDAIAGFGPGPEAETWYERQKDRLWTGRRDRFFANLETLGQRRGPPPKKAAPSDPRRILATDLAYFRTNQAGLDYPTFRQHGWPTGSSIIESTVKQVGKRVKGSEKFWSLPGAEQTLQVVTHLVSNDGSWDRFWDGHPLTSSP